MISLAMIVRNEAKHLAACLNNVRHLVGEIIIVDTGSTDETIGIARQYTDKIYSFPWENDFSAARNYAIEQCTGDWILSLDADERLDSSRGTLQQLIARYPEREAFFLPIYCQASAKESSADTCIVLRLFRNLPCYRFRGKIHEQIPWPNQEAVMLAPFPLIHHAASGSKERNRKRHRNLLLLQQELTKQPEQLHYRYYISLEWLAWNHFDRALPGLRQVYGSLTETNITFRASAARHIIYCLRMTGKLAEALAQTLQAAAEYPSYADIYFEGGLTLEQMQEYEAACRWFQAALDSGPPAPVFVHAVGTESFLASYHLGYCREKMQDFSAALATYRQALTQNPSFYYPLYPLCSLLLRRYPPAEMLSLLHSGGYLARPEWARALAEFFFAAGEAEAAVLCSQKAGEDAAGKLPVYLLYSGRALDVVAMYNRLSPASSGAPLPAEYTLACLLCQNWDEARQAALALWRSPACRSTAWVLLCLLDFYTGQTQYLYPEPAREPEIIASLLSILEHCLRCSAVLPSAGGLTQLSHNCILALTERTRTGPAALAAYWDDRRNRCEGKLAEQTGLPKELWSS
ncbi:nucleotide-diphospho-sugar transferases [Lucifera butyrica]|uniref:Nucleotide-diphospho-sugar transferases n=2 Tax=Lucifera butyrica TaxID=1351585 RepID=A0A498QZ65_9FIRM|nr:nucleotide-diphospho-sugar transferases [Lucifera butyrica]